MSPVKSDTGRPGHDVRARAASAWFHRLVMAALAVSGIAQMPVFKRYGIASIPGLGWTADYFFTHRMHYLAAALLLFWLARGITQDWLGRDGEPGLELSLGLNRGLNRTRLWLLGALVLTGGVRVLKNLPEVSFSPLATMLVDWTHLAAALAIGVAALWALATRRIGVPVRNELGKNP